MLSQYLLGSPSLVANFAAWNIVKATYKEAMEGKDVLTLTIQQSIGTADKFTNLEQVRLFFTDGTLLFTGYNTKAGVQAKGNSQLRTYTIEGPAMFLDKVIFRHPMILWNDTTDWPGSNVPPNPNNGASFSGVSFQFVSRVILGRQTLGFQSLQKLTLTQQLQAILSYALGNTGTNWSTNPDGTEYIPMTWNGANVPAIWFPDTEETDITIRDGISRMLNWCPYIGYRVNYNSEVPQLWFDTTLGGGTWGDNGAQAYIVGAGDTRLTDFDGTVRWDLLVPAVEITVLFGNTVLDPNDPSSYANLSSRHVDYASVSNGGFGTVRSTVIVRGPIYNVIGSNSYQQDGEVVPTNGLAASVLSSCDQAYAEGKLTLTDQDCDWTFHPGIPISFTGFPSLAGAQAAVITSIERELGKGTTTLNFGPPHSLGLKGRLGLLQGNRLVRANNSSAGMVSMGLQKSPANDSPVAIGTNNSIQWITATGNGGTQIVKLNGMAVPNS